MYFILQEEIKIEIAVAEEKPEPVENPFQQVYVSCPDGLAVSYSIDNSVGMLLRSGVIIKNNYKRFHVCLDKYYICVCIYPISMCSLRLQTCYVKLVLKFTSITGLRRQAGCDSHAADTDGALDVYYLLNILFYQSQFYCIVGTKCLDTNACLLTVTLAVTCLFDWIHTEIDGRTFTSGYDWVV